MQQRGEHPTNTTTTASKITARLDELPLGGFHRRLLFASGFGWMFDAMDVGLISFVLAALVGEWKLHPSQAGLISSSGFLGMFAGALLAGLLADRFGRKPLFQGTLLIYSIATGLCALAGNIGTLLGFRFLVGLGLGGELPVASTLVSEFSPARRRGLMIVLLESFWAYGWVLAAIIGYLVIPRFGWRIAFLIGAVPALYVLILRRGVPESPRFLAGKGRTAEAESVMRQVDGSTAGGSREGGAGRAAASRSTAQAGRWRELFSPQLRRRTIMLWLTWFGIVFSYYGIFAWLPSLLRATYPLVTTFQYTLIITLAQIPGYFSAAWLVERWGRKPTLAVYLLLCAVGAFFFRGAGSASQILIWGCVISFFNLGAWGVLYTYTPELYPTRIRSSGAGSATAFGRIGGIIGPYIVGLLLPAWGASIGVIFALFAAVFLAVALIVFLMGTETRGSSLEKIAGEP
ncbi:MAG: MFS transporter [Spirochaetia bacterium]